jgi:hypothetical protein
MNAPAVQGPCMWPAIMLPFTQSDRPRPVIAFKRALKGRACVLRPFQYPSSLREIEARFDEKLWAFAPVESGNRWVLGVFVANELHPSLVDSRLCSASCREELLPYADALNRERGLLTYHTLLITRGAGLSNERISDWRAYVSEYVRERRTGGHS